MTQLSIELPDTLTAYLQEQIATGNYTDPSKYIASLIQQDLDRKTRLEQKLLESLESPSSPMDRADWDYIRQQVRHNISAGEERA
jgi:antitoxin ParD1/3/4